MTQPGKRCIFCGERGNITKQHILPDRIKNLLPRMIPYHSHSTERIFYKPDGSVALVLPIRKLKEGHIGNRKFRVVCHACNTGWMKAAEEAAFVHAESLILGKTLVLDREAQAELALLAALIMTMVDLTDLPTSTISESDRRFIWERRTIPPSWFLFIGRVKSPQWHTRYRHDAAIWLPEGGVPTDQASNTQVTTVAMGQLVLHLAASQVSPILSDADVYAQLTGFARLPSISGAEIDMARLPLHDTASMTVVSNSLIAAMQGGGR